MVGLLVRSGTDPDSKVHGANTGPTWVLPAPDGPHVDLMNLAIMEPSCQDRLSISFYQMYVAISVRV